MTTERLYILAHTQVQLDVFLRNHRIARDRVRRVMSARDVEGVSTDNPLIMLPGYYQSPGCDEILAIWHNRRGTCLRISEPAVLGQQPLCANDTDGDGDCHLCHRRGGCKWPRGQYSH